MSSYILPIDEPEATYTLHIHRYDPDRAAEPWQDRFQPGDQAGQARLARTGRSPENHRMESIVGDGVAQGTALTEQIILSDDLLDTAYGMLSEFFEQEPEEKDGLESAFQSHHPPTVGGC